MNNSVTPHTALVFGGGGSSGNAWLIGVVAGLAEVGLDVTDADVIIGTSAGATAAAQLLGASPADVLAATLATPPQHPTGTTTPGAAGPGAGGARAGQVGDHLGRLERIIAASENADDLRRRISADALESDAASDGTGGARWRAIVGARLPSPTWPEQELRITALDVRTAMPVVFDSRSGIDLVDAVAASTSGVTPYRIGEGLYLDGGYRSNADNADLAAGCARVLVLSPLGGRSLHPVGWGTHLATQVEALRAGGSQVETVLPRSESEHLFGANAMDLSLRSAAAQAGWEQGRGLAERLTEFWR